VAQILRVAQSEVAAAKATCESRSQQADRMLAEAAQRRR